jgi:hypothetical protein
MSNFFSYESMWLKRKLYYLHVSNSCGTTLQLLKNYGVTLRPTEGLDNKNVTGSFRSNYSY